MPSYRGTLLTNWRLVCGTHLNYIRRPGVRDLNKQNLAFLIPQKEKEKLDVM